MCASSPKEMIAGGLRARIVCVDPQVLPVEFADPEFDAGFLRDLPHGVDPCGEKGEFHTTVYAGPTFRKPIPIETGEIVKRDGFIDHADAPGRAGSGSTLLSTAKMATMETMTISDTPEEISTRCQASILNATKPRMHASP